jgi:VWFA-related protein
MIMKQLHVLILCGLLLPLVSDAWAQETAVSADTPDSGEIFLESVDVNVVNLLVWVTDKKGNPVGGLRRDDFELFEDGRPVRISNFFAVESGKPAASRIPSELALEDTQDTSLPLLAIPEEQRLNLIVYIDNFNIAPANRNRVLRRLRGFLYDTIDREDQIMVVSHDRSLHIRQPFTNDPDLALDALVELERLSGHSTDRLATRLRVLQTIEQLDDGAYALSEARSHADYVSTEMRFTLKRLRSIVNSLSGLEGRKALLYVSDGLPMTPAEDLFLAVDERFPRVGARAEAMGFDLSPEFRKLGAQANSAGVTFYTLDAGGAETHASLSAEDPGTAQGGSRIMVDSLYIANLQEPLHMIADATGGLAVTNTNAVERSLDRVGRDFDNYYSLGFPAEHGRTGRYYKLKAKVKRPGLRVRHRDGYRDQTREKLLADGSLAALYFDYQHNLIEAKVVFRPGSTSPDGNYVVPLAVQVPLANLTLVPDQERHIGRFRVAFAVMNDKGEVSAVQQLAPVTVEIPQQDIEMARSRYYTYETQLLMRRGNSKVAVSIHDELSDQSSFVHRTVSVGSSGAGSS